MPRSWTGLIEHKSDWGLNKDIHCTHVKKKERDLEERKEIIYVQNAQSSQNVPSEHYRAHQDTVTLFMA